MPRLPRATFQLHIIATKLWQILCLSNLQLLDVCSALQSTTPLLEMPSRHPAHLYLWQILQVPQTHQTKSLDWNGMEDVSKTSAATLRQPAEEVVLLPTTTGLVSSPGGVQLSLTTMRHLVPQATRASPDNMGSPPLEYVDIFIANFILLTHGPIEQQQQVWWILLECLDSVIPPLDHTDQKEWKEEASIKKLLNGDGCQMALKTVLSWADCYIMNTTLYN